MTGSCWGFESSVLRNPDTNIQQVDVKHFSPSEWLAKQLAVNMDLWKIIKWDRFLCG